MVVRTQRDCGSMSSSMSDPTQEGEPQCRWTNDDGHPSWSVAFLIQRKASVDPSVGCGWGRKEREAFCGGQGGVGGDDFHSRETSTGERGGSSPRRRSMPLQQVAHPPSSLFLFSTPRQHIKLLQKVKRRAAGLLNHQNLSREQEPSRTCFSATYQILRIDVSPAVEEHLNHLLLRFQRRLV